MNLIVTSTFTSEPLEDYLSWWAKTFSVKIDIKFIQYDRIFQELINEDSQTSKNENGSNVFLIRFEDFIRYDKSSDEVKINKLKRNYNELLEILYIKKKKVQYYFFVFPIDSQNLGIKLTSYLDELNNSFKKSLSTVENTSVIDIRHLNELYLIDDVFDRVKDKVAHIPFTQEYYSVLAKTIFRNIQLEKQHIFKVIIVDCDNTIWKGIVGEDGPENVKIENGYKFLQNFLIKRYEEGMLLAICSKNNEIDVWEVFDKNENMILKKDFFVTWKINWENKALNIREIAAELNLSLDSFIFIDDSSKECFSVMTELPEVLTLCLPDKSENFDRFLNQVWAFDKHKVSKNEKNRSKHYITEKQRQSMRKESISLKDYLSALNLKVSMNLVKSGDINRVSQLSMRTNQFNSTTIRRNEKEVKYLIESGYKVWTIDVSDEFGDYGLVGAVFSYIKEKSLIVDSFLLSCRALSRSIEDTILFGLNKFSLENNCEIIVIKFRKSDKNLPFSDFMDRMNFRVSNTIDNFKSYYMKVDLKMEKESYIDFFYKRKHEKRDKIEKQTKQYYLDHVGVIVYDINEVSSTYRDLDFNVGSIIYDKLQNVNLVMCNKKGKMSIELISVYNDESPVKRTLDRIGEGPYHLCYSVESVELFIKDLKENNINFELISDKKNAILFNNKDVAFIHIKSVGVIELLEVKKEDYERNEIYNDNIVRLITGNINEAVKVFSVLGYIKHNVYKEVDNNLITIIMEKDFEKIELIMPTENNAYENNLLQKFGAHPYKLCFEVKELNNYMEYIESKNIKYTNADLENQYGYLREKSEVICILEKIKYLNVFKKRVELSNIKKEFLWDLKIVNYENLKHKNQYISLKYHTARSLHDLPIYELVNKKSNLSEFVGPRNTAERKMHKYWSEVLKISDFGVNDNFFSIGGNSLDAVNVIALAIVEFDINLDDIFKYETISNLVQNVKFNKNTLNISLEKFNKLIKYFNKKCKLFTDYKKNLYEKEKEYEKEIINLKEKDLNICSDYHSILLVGATGYYGIHILYELLVGTDFCIYLIIRANSDEEAADRLLARYKYYFDESIFEVYKSRLNIFAGDVTKENFDLSRFNYNSMSNKIDCIINSAANVKHFGRYTEFESVNVNSLKRIVDFAVRGKLKDIHHISTINVAQGSVANKEFIYFTELDNHFDQKEENVYIKSKLESEKIIFDAREKGLKCNIYRAGNLAASDLSKNQINFKENAFSILINSMVNIKIAPKISCKNMDLTYVDHASKAFVKIFNKKYLINRNYHIYNPNKVGFENIGEILQKLEVDIQFVDLDLLSEKLEEKTNTNMQDVVNFVMHASYIIGEEGYTSFITQNKLTNEILNYLNFEWKCNKNKYIDKIKF